MMFLRPIEEKDQHQFIELVHLSHIGLTSLPKEKRILLDKLHTSLASFKKAVSFPHKEKYLFVLEDTTTNKIIGMSAIRATTGGDEPLYFYKKEVIDITSHLEHVVKKIPILTPISYVHGPSELCSLYLHPQFRKSGYGRLLSLARFLFIACFPERFTATLFAALRGVIDNDISPFWNGIGHHFFNVSFAEVLDMSIYGKQFISHFLPQHPIYIPLLPYAVQNVIGTAHENSQAALSMLLQQGFQISDEVDIFDGGPILRAMTGKISAVELSKKLEITHIVDEIKNGTNCIISNDRIDFRAISGSIEIIGQDCARITSTLSDILSVGLGDWIRIIGI